DIYKDAQHFYTPEQFAEDMADPENLFLAASVCGKLVGMCQIKYHTAGDGSITRKRQRAYVEAICVDEKYRNRGIGKLLLMKPDTEIFLKWN
ncbi:MAG TPA: GNAT family N-acetyltransferase, partial [Candidatus Blautia stercoravium]|nr:GNAT family N-acetyltransferase [Candidatus Blautia stercoravium]